MWRPLFFSSLLLLPLTAAARWRVELRPLDVRPYALEVKPLVSLHPRSGLSHLEGLGTVLPAGQATAVFDVPLAVDARPRELEFHLAHLSEEATFGGGACSVALRVEGAAGSVPDVALPLRSLEPGNIDERALRARYDALFPEVRVPVKAGATRLSVTATPSAACGDGKVVLLAPHVWRKESDGPPKRLIFVASDAISADWLEQGRRFMPFTQDFFRHGGARLNTRVFSVGTNTHDTTQVLSRMRLELRDAHALGTTGPARGLVPAFLDGGYEVLSFNSNLLLSTAWRHAGFRLLFNLNVSGTPLNERHPELLVAMMKDWLRRHPDHDVFFFTWFDATHHNGPAPRVRPGFSPEKSLRRGAPWSQKYLDMQARSLSYVDLAMEELLTDKLASQADVLFFSDHGLNFQSLEHPEPLWGKCVTRHAPANWHAGEVELRVPVGFKVRGFDPGDIPFDTSLLDWVYTAVRRHNPELPFDGRSGVDVTRVTANTPVVSVSHGLRGAVRLGGVHHLFEDACSEGGVPSAYDASGNALRGAARERVLGALGERGLGGMRAWDLELYAGDGGCRLEVGLPPGVRDEHGGALPELLRVDPSRWYTRVRMVVPALAPAAALPVVVTATPEGCAEVRAGYVRRPLRGAMDVSRAGLWALAGVDGPKVAPAAGAVVRLRRRDEPLRWDGTRFGAEVAASPETQQLSSEIRAAMKKWGYIQDE